MNDKGSWLGRIWWKICGGGENFDIRIERAATMGVRCTISILTAIAFIPLAFIDFYYYIICALILIFVTPFIFER